VNGLTLHSIAAGPAFSCGIAVSGAAYCWGANGLGQTGEGTQISYGNTFRNLPMPVAGNLTFASISLGYQFSCGLTTDALAYCWGSNGGRLGNGLTADASSPRAVAGGRTYTQIASGFGHSCAVATVGDLYCWGSNSSGQLGAGGAFSYSPVLSAGGLKVAEVGVAGIGTGSGSFTCAVSKDRLTTYCWGRNEFGQLGNGTTSLATAVNAAPTIVVGQKPL
jgi:alpha-tubulin suppressor-like RCC1 family protein